MKNIDLGELEKEIMEVVWANKQPITVRKVFDTINAKRNIAYTTVMTIMGRLADKGYLKREICDKAHTYKATYSKDKFLQKISRQIINNLLLRFGDTALAHFTEELEKIPVVKRKNLTRILNNSKDEN